MRFISTVLASAIGGLIAIAVFVMFFIALLAGLAVSDSGAPAIRKGSVLTVRLSGDLPEITQTAPLEMAFGGRSAISLRDVTRAIRHAGDDDRIAALWVMPDHVSSSWASLEEIRSAVEAFRESGKPTVATSSADGFSERDYFVASAAENVFSPSEARFEFNGFVIVTQYLKRMLDKIGVQAETVRSGRFKSAVETFTRDHGSDENIEQLQSLVDSQAETFLWAVADSRGLTYEALDELVQSAAVVDAEDALEEGLLDAEATDDEVMSIIADSLLALDEEPEFVTIFEYARTVPTVVSGSAPRESIAILYAVGTIADGSSGYDADPLFGGKVVGSNDVVAALRELREDEHVKAVVLRVDSPGGSGQAADVIWQAVRQTADEKPVIASMGGLAASGGYYIAAGADSIIADASSITGSIGVFSILINSSGLLEDKLGITFDAIKTAPTADMYSGLRNLTSFEREILERGVNKTYDRFTRAVAEGRGLRLTEVLEIADGRVWTGSQALQNGLVDQVGGLEDAVQMAASAANLDSTGYQIEIYPKERTFIERLWQFASATESRLRSELFSGSMSAAAARQIRLLREIEQLHCSVQTRIPMTISIE